MMSEWKRVALGDLIEVQHGYAFSGEHIKEHPPGDILLTPGNFAVGGGFRGEKFKYFDGAVPEEYVLTEGDLIVTMTDLSKESDTLGYPALVPKVSGARYLHNQRLGKVLVKPGAGVDRRFLFHLLKTSEYRHEILASATGTTVKHTSPGRILAYKATIPGMESQKAIADVLGSIDEKIELNHRVNETLESMARALFKDWFIDFGPVRAKMESRQPPGLAPEIAALFPNRLDGDGKPEGWVVEPLLKHARLISGGTPKTEVSDYWGGSIWWASAKDVSQCGEAFLIDTERTITERGLEESSTRLIPKFATVVVARGATTGRLCMFGHEMAMNQTCYAIQSVEGTPYWLNCSFVNLVAGLVHAAHGSVFDTITTRTIDGAKVIVSPANLRRRFECLVEPLFSQILSGIRENRALTSLRDLLLPKLLSGELPIAVTGDAA